MKHWLAQRRPEPPEPLARWLEALRMDALGPDESSDAGPETAHAKARADTLATEALAALDRARAAPGRVRESAFHLLAGDALLTYACEAALECASPDEVLQALITRTAASER